MSGFIFMGWISFIFRIGCLSVVTFQSPQVVDLPRPMLGAACSGGDLDIFLMFVKGMMARRVAVRLRWGSIVSFLGTKKLDSQDKLGLTYPS